jgi:hypothetical protein
MVLLLAGWCLCNAQIQPNLTFSLTAVPFSGGAGVGIEYPVRSTLATKHHREERKMAITRDVFISGSLTWYHDPGFQHNFCLTPGFRIRRTRPSGVFWEFSSGIGYARTFLSGTTYRVSETGQVTVKKLAGYNCAFAMAGEGLGFDFSRRNSLPLMIKGSIDLYSFYPYSSTFYPQPVINVGFVYKPSHFLALQPVSRKLPHEN